MRRARADRPELDPPVAQLVLHLVGEELLSAIGLNALNGKRHGRAQLPQKGNRVGGSLAREDAGDLPAGAIVDCSVLIDAGGNLADIDLNAIAGHRPTVSLAALAAQAGPLQQVLAVPNQNLVDGVEREPQAMLADQLVA